MKPGFFPVSDVPSGGGGFRPCFPLLLFSSYPFSSLLTVYRELGATKTVASRLKGGLVLGFGTL
jgi:hypothetical protein